MEFPRLFYVGMREVKNLLMEPGKLMRGQGKRDCFGRLFAGVEGFIMGEGQQEDRIRGVMGSRGETVMFKKPILCRIIWSDLRTVL